MSLAINGIHFKLDDEIKDYIHSKIENLITNHFPDSDISSRVFISQSKNSTPFNCEVVVSLPSQTICAHQSGMTAKAAVDLTADRLARQIRKYKTVHNQADHRQSVRYDDIQ